MSFLIFLKILQILNKCDMLKKKKARCIPWVPFPPALRQLMPA